VNTFQQEKERIKDMVLEDISFLIIPDFCNINFGNLEERVKYRIKEEFDINIVNVADVLNAGLIYAENYWDGTEVYCNFTEGHRGVGKKLSINKIMDCAKQTICDDICDAIISNYVVSVVKQEK